MQLKAFTNEYTLQKLPGYHFLYLGFENKIMMLLVNKYQRYILKVSDIFYYSSVFYDLLYHDSVNMKVVIRGSFSLLLNRNVCWLYEYFPNKLFHPPFYKNDTCGLCGTAIIIFGLASKKAPFQNNSTYKHISIQPRTIFKGLSILNVILAPVNVTFMKVLDGKGLWYQQN